MVAGTRRVIVAGILAVLPALLLSCGGHGRPGGVLPPTVHFKQASVQNDPYTTAVLADGPTAYYRLDDTGSVAADSSGNGLNGTVGTGVSENAGGLLASSSDSAMLFPGTANTTGTVVVPQTIALQPALTVTVEAWLRFATVPTQYTVALAYGDDSVYAPYDLYFAGGKIVAQFYLNSGVLIVSSPALSVNTTYYVAASFDGATARLYLNGALVSSVAKSGTLTGYKSGFGFTIGDDAGFSDPAFKGTIDEVAIYAGKALSATQIQNHYKAGTTAPSGSPSPSPSASPTPTPTPVPTPTSPPPSGGYASTVLADAPTAYYHLDDTGSSAADSSGSGLSGSIGSSIAKNAAGLVPSMNDTAMSFPGLESAAGMVSFTSTTLLQPVSAVSMEMWLRFASTPALYTIALAYGDDTFYAPYDLYFVNGKIAAQFYLNTGVLVVTSPNALAINTTYYVAATYDGTTGRLYLNGVQVSSVSKSGTFIGYKSGFGLGIGDDTGHSDPGFKGTIDEVAIYSGKALSATRLQAHYAAGTSGTVTPTPSPVPSATASPSPAPTGLVDWKTFGVDLQRTGYNPNETAIGANNVSGLHSYWPQSANVGNGQVGEPVVAANVSINGNPTNVLYAGAQPGLFKAINADTGVTIWSKQLGSTSYSCGSGSSAFGIEGTAVIDRATNRIYVPDGQAQVHALDLATGTEASGWPLTIATPADHNFIYAGLTYNPANGILYVETSSTCDISPWYGRIEAINAATATPLNTFYPTQGSSGGGIWGFGGASVDPATNNVFVAVGNADSTTQNLDYAEQIVELSANVGTVLANNYPNLPVSGDADFGATPLLFQPSGCPPMLAAVNKSGVFVLYNRSTISSGPVQIIQMSASLDQGDFIGVPAFDPVTNDVYVGLPTTFGIYKPGMAAFGIQSNCTLNPTPVWSAVFGPDGTLTTNDSPRSAISIANGVVYISGYSNGTTYAFNAATGAQLWSASIPDYGIVGPVIVNGHLYVGSYGGAINAWTP